MKRILISPCSQKLRVKENESLRNNPKNYPYWLQVIESLKTKGYTTLQVGVAGEPDFKADELYKGLSLHNLHNLLCTCDTWISVDNFFGHFATYYKKPGIVIFGRSDPKLFGYEQNINLLKDRKYLRQNQFDIWENDIFTEEAFVAADVVVDAVEEMLQLLQGNDAVKL